MRTYTDGENKHSAAGEYSLARIDRGQKFYNTSLVVSQWVKPVVVYFYHCDHVYNVNKIS